MRKYLMDKRSEIMNWANIIFLFLFSVHLFSFPDKYILLWCAFAISVFAVKHKTLCLDKIFWIFVAAILINGLGTYYYLGSDMNWSWGNVIKMTVPVIIVYPFMKQMVYEKDDIFIRRVLLAIAMGTFVYSLLNYYSLLVHGFENGVRIWSEFWTVYPMNATHHSYWGCFIVGLIGYGFFCILEKKWMQGSVILVFIVIENLIQMAADNRMVLCVTLVALFVSVLLYILFNYKNKKKIQRIITIILIAIAVIAIIFSADIFGIRSSGYFQRFMTRDGGIMKNIRFQMIYEAIMKLPSHWKGGATMNTAGFYRVHNYWLQVANVSGIIPFTLWMIVNISTMIDIVKVIRTPRISNKIKYMLLPMLASIVGYLMMEPGGTESNRYIIFYVILIALLKQLANRDTTNVGVEDVQISSEI